MSNIRRETSSADRMSRLQQDKDMLGEEVKSQKVRTVTSWGSTLTGFLAEHLHKLGRMENVVELSARNGLETDL